MRAPFYEVESLNGSTIRLFLDDCVEGMKRILKPGMVSTVITSPPYNIGISYSKYNDKLPREEYLDWIERVARGVERVLDEDGSFFLNVGSTPSDPWIPLDVAQRLRSIFTLQNVIHWVKSIAICKNDIGEGPNVQSDIAVGHYKPIGGTRFLNDCHEFIFHLTKTGNVPLDRLAIGVPYQDKSNLKRWKAAAKDLRCRGNTWFIPYQTIWSRQKQRPHPSTFPERLPEMCIKIHGIARTKMVLDPLIGLGSTATAAFRLGVSCIGFDIDPDYLSEARKRLKALASLSHQIPQSQDVSRNRTETFVPA